jgi:Uma2 family endonuclease
MVIEVANTSLDTDRDDKSRIYACVGLPMYWIVNVVDRQIEVYEQPSGPTANPAYGTQRIFRPCDAVPVVLDGATIRTIRVVDLLP